MNRRQRREQLKKRKNFQNESEIAGASSSYHMWNGSSEKIHHTEPDLVPGVNCPPERTREFKSKCDGNIWHDRSELDLFIETIKRLSVEEDYDWSWAYNSKCKYLNLRFDMRDGGFIVTNADGHRIELPQLAWQWKSGE